MYDRPYWHCDTECYPNYWSIGFTSHDDPSKTFSFVKYNDSPLDIQAIVNLLSRVTIITFNGNHYDESMILYALTGASNQQLHWLNDYIIKDGMKPWEIQRTVLQPYYNNGDWQNQRYQRPDWLDHIDISEPAPGVKVSLKVYMGRTHSETMQDIPIEPGTWIRDEDLALMERYRGNDETGTRDLFNKIKDRIDLRIAMSKRYGIDLRSKSDAQIAETVITHLLGFKVEKPFWPHGTKFKYQAPAWMQFQTPQMQTVFEMVKNATFETSDKDQVHEGGEVDDNGKPIKIKTGIIMPKEVKDCRITMGITDYKFGIGGLHSMEKHRAWRAEDGYELSDHDAASFYPKIILNEGYYPTQMGPKFLEVYGGIVNERLSDKANLKYSMKMMEAAAGFPEWESYYQAWGAHYKTGESSLKIVINGSFGKLGSKYSKLFAPDLLIQTTITGQLSLLMLIEMFELNGIQCVSANTDGIVVRTPPGLQPVRTQVIQWWESVTRHTTEQTNYSAIYSRDVNNYVAVTTEGKVKRKGVLAEPTLMKSPNNTICVDAVVEYLTKGTPISDTILFCRDITKFVTIRAVKGGAVKGDVILGKAVRWYYSSQEMGTINYRTNGNRVPRSEGARPIMKLPTQFPGDVDYQWYMREATAILEELGVKGQ